MGVNVKYLAHAEEVLGRREGVVGWALSDGPVNMTWDATQGQEGEANGCLVAFSGGPSAAACIAFARTKKRDGEYGLLAGFYPKWKEQFVKSRFMDWPSDPFTKASYSFPAPGQLTTQGPMLEKGAMEQKGSAHCTLPASTAARSLLDTWEAARRRRGWGWRSGWRIGMGWADNLPNTRTTLHRYQDRRTKTAGVEHHLGSAEGPGCDRGCASRGTVADHRELDARPDFLAHRGVHRVWLRRVSAEPESSVLHQVDHPAAEEEVPVAGDAGGVKIPGIPGGTLGAGYAPFEAGIERLRRAWDRLEKVPPVHPSPAFGPMPHEDVIRLNLKHSCCTKLSASAVRAQRGPIEQRGRRGPIWRHERECAAVIRFECGAEVLAEAGAGSPRRSARVIGAVGTGRRGSVSVTWQGGIDFCFDGYPVVGAAGWPRGRRREGRRCLDGLMAGFHIPGVEGGTAAIEAFSAR